MLELSLTVDWGEGPQTAQTNGWTVIQFERKTKQKYTQIAQQGLGMVVPDFDRFCKQVKSVDVDAPDTNPTHGGATEEQ
jgi:hypothetical protein